MKLNEIKKPHNVYAEFVESGAIDQFVSAMEMDFSIRGALMPDTHQGYSLPIGAAVATEGVVLPAWVGYDIGCGMCAVPVDIAKEELVANKEAIFNEIYKQVPVGFNINQHIPEGATGLNLNDLSDEGRGVIKEWESRKGKDYRTALGSLGGGNHFIEVGCDEDDRVWIVIHSGSRGIGHGVATYYMKLAGGGRAREGHFALRTDEDSGRGYINDMNWSLQFALDNREEMIRRVMRSMSTTIGGSVEYAGELINRNHNHATERDGSWIHRKGATHAEEDMAGVIPGNMRDGSFIVKGKGNAESLYSSSHGAGRVLGRKQAKATLNMDDFKDTMQGIAARVDEGTLDESPFAYKNIFEVMELQKDLVSVEHHIKPIINCKG